MSFNDEYQKLRRKRMQEEANAANEKNAGKPRLLYQNKTAALKSPSEVAEEDIAPVKQTNEDDKKWYDGWFKKGAYEDGYQRGDFLKTNISSSKDLESSLWGGILGIGEKVVDAGAFLAGGVGGLFGADEFKDKTKEFIAKDLYDEKAVAEKLVEVRNPIYWFTDEKEEYSLYGDKSDSLVESGGQLLGTMALQSVGVPWYLTTGTTSFGGETENAFNQGASYGEAGLSGVITAGAEILTEKLSGGIKFGGSTLDDALTKKLATGISNKAVRTMAKLGMDVAGEGSEEVISQFISNLGSSLYKEENLEDILFSGSSPGLVQISDLLVAHIEIEQEEFPDEP